MGQSKQAIEQQRLSERRISKLVDPVLPEPKDKSSVDTAKFPDRSALNERLGGSIESAKDFVKAWMQGLSAAAIARFLKSGTMTVESNGKEDATVNEVNKQLKNLVGVNQPRNIKALGQGLENVIKAGGVNAAVDYVRRLRQQITP